MYPSDEPNYDRWLYVASLVVVAICAYLIVSSINIARATGILKVTSADAKAAVSISQQNKQAQFIGIGNAEVRLKPGTYTVAAREAGKEVFKDVKISLKQTTSVTLNPKDAVILPSVLSVTFQGFDEFIKNGLTDVQVNRLKNYFFRYQPTTKIVSIVPGSVRPAPRNPNTAIGFTSDFRVSLDSNPYAAKINYSIPGNPEGVRLFLYTANGQQVYDSGPL